MAQNHTLQQLEALGEPKPTDYARWRLHSSDHGRHVWHYLKTDDECAKWPQSDEDKHWLGMDVNAPKLTQAQTPLEAARNGFSFYRRIHSADGHWSGEYGGPLFLLPGLVIGMYVTETPIPDEWSREIRRYLLNKRNEDGGWGLHIAAGSSTVFGTSCNYAVCRILGMHSEHPAMIKARALLHKLGGAVGAPAWAKMWLAILNVYDYEGMNPAPPELWCMPDWVPFHPWRWWVHTRQVYTSMGFLWAKRFKAPVDPLIESLRQELYVQPYESIHWPSQRNNVAAVDIWAPHTRVLDGIMAVVGLYESCGGIPPLRRAGMKRAYELLCMEDENTSYQCIGPVNKMFNYIARWSEEGPDSEAVKLHREKLNDFMWVGREGMMMQATNGSQLWDTAFVAQALVDSGLVHEPETRQSCESVLAWLDDCQIREDPKHCEAGYRFRTKGAWPFSTKEQGYIVSDCAGEALKAVVMLQSDAGLPERITEDRLRDTVDRLLSMQNPDGGFASYEKINGPAIMEWLNPAEVFGDIMIEINYPECTNSAITGLLKFSKISDYRAADIDRCVKAAFKYILRAQRPDGSWFGSWAVCFTYASMFALESLQLAGQSYGNSEPVRRACTYLLSRQRADGGWGEAYQSFVQGKYIQAETSQVVQTAWVVISLLHAKCPDTASIKRGVKLIMSRQREDGSWADENTMGVFNRNSTTSYPNYVFSFTIWALGKAQREIKDW